MSFIFLNLYYTVIFSPNIIFLIGEHGRFNQVTYVHINCHCSITLKKEKKENGNKNTCVLYLSVI